MKHESTFIKYLIETSFKIFTQGKEATIFITHFKIEHQIISKDFFLNFSIWKKIVICLVLDSTYWNSTLSQLDSLKQSWSYRIAYFNWWFKKPQILISSIILKCENMASNFSFQFLVQNSTFSSLLDGFHQNRGLVILRRKFLNKL